MKVDTTPLIGGDLYAIATKLLGILFHRVNWNADLSTQKILVVVIGSTVFFGLSIQLLCDYRNGKKKSSINRIIQLLRRSPYATMLGVYAVTYIITVIFSYSFLDLIRPIESRFVSPVYFIGFVFVPILFAVVFKEKVRLYIGFMAAAFYFSTTMPSALEWHGTLRKHGSSQWLQRLNGADSLSKAIANLVPDTMIVYSNTLPRILTHTTKRTIYQLPLMRSYNSSIVVPFEIEDYDQTVFTDFENDRAVLAWFGKNEQAPDSILSLYNLESRYVVEDGVIYYPLDLTGDD